LNLGIKSRFFCKKARTNSEQIGEESFQKTTLFHWLKFKYIQIQFFEKIKKLGKFCKKTRTNSEQISEEFFFLK
jgi:hypothetical protein